MKKLYFQKFLENKPYVPLLDGNNHIGSVDESNQSFNKLPSADFDLTALLDFVTSENLLSKAFIKDLASLLQSTSAPWNYIVPVVESTILLSEDVTFELNKDSVENLLSAYATLYQNPYERYLEVVNKPRLINPKDNHTRVYFTNKFNEFKALDKEDTYAEFTLTPEDMVAKSKINVVAETLEEQNRNIMRKRGDSSNETNTSNAEIPKEQSNGFSDSPKEEGVIQEQDSTPQEPVVEEFNEQQIIEEVQEEQVQEQTSDKEVTLMSNENNEKLVATFPMPTEELNFGSTPLDLSSSSLDEKIETAPIQDEPIESSLPENTLDELEEETIESEELQDEELVEETIADEELQDEELVEEETLEEETLEEEQLVDEEITQDEAIAIQEIHAEKEVAATNDYIHTSQAAELSKMIQEGKSVQAEDIENPVELPQQEGSVDDLFANSKLTEKVAPKKLHNEDFSNAFSTAQSGQVIKGTADSTEEKLKAAQEIMSTAEPINKRAQSPINKEEVNEVITRNEQVVQGEPEQEEIKEPVPQEMTLAQPPADEDFEVDEFDYSIPEEAKNSIPLPSVKEKISFSPPVAIPVQQPRPKLMPVAETQPLDESLPEPQPKAMTNEMVNKEQAIHVTPAPKTFAKEVVIRQPLDNEKTPPTYKELEETIREVSMEWSKMLDDTKERHSFEIAKLKSQHEIDLVRQRNSIEEEQESVKRALEMKVSDLEQQLKSLSKKSDNNQIVQELNAQISSMQLAYDEERQGYLEHIRQLEEKANKSLSELSKFKSEEASTKPVEHLPVKKVADVKRYQEATRKFLNESTQGNITLQDFYSIKQEENVFPKHGVTGVIIKPKKG
ncbi:MAG: hypothetical protein ABS904_00015 [Solibacillus isronensis]